MEIKKIIQFLEAAAREPALLPETISRLQEVVWTSSALPMGVEEDLRGLAYDLDYFEPDPTRRNEDPTFIDHDTAIAEIRQVIAKLRKVSGDDV
jgi:hypothetical protein